MSTPFVVVGDLMTDVVARPREPLRHATDTPGTISTHGGGAGANTAAWLADAKIATTYVGVVGDDLAGAEALTDLRRTGLALAVRVDPVAPTGTVIVIVDPDGQRTMVPDPGANSALSPQDLPDDAFVQGAHLHLSGYTLLNAGSRLAGLAALDLARLRRMTTSVDPASAGPIKDTGVDEVLGWFAGVDVLLCNDDEALALTGLSDATAAGTALAQRFPIVVVKVGAKGAMVWRDGVGPVASPAVTVDVVDTTGAGDAFAAGFLAAWTSGADPVACLARGNRLSAKCVSSVGARP